ncbi:P-loop containing nucleoside triphosphate hydrolase protein [Mycena floridula]|nr:P-loop containing nucleoside triphosphate hydrolase protein [Mycena floridula]
MPSCAQDRSFGPTSTCRDLDFTLYFEQTILSFGPDVLFVVLAVFRLVLLKLQPRHVKSSTLGYALLALKGSAALVILASTITSLAYSSHRQIFSASLDLAAPIVQILSATLLTLLVLIEHFQSVSPSTLIITYAFIKGVFNAAIMRSSIQIGDPIPTTAILALITAAYIFLSFLELVGKPRVLVNKNVPKVSSSSFLSRSFCLWLYPLLWTGRKKTLTIADCGSIPIEMGAVASTEPLRNALLTMSKQNHYLVYASLRAFPLMFLSPIFPRILLLLAAFMQPLLALRMITYISDSNQSSERGWALVGGFVCTYALIFLMTSMYWEKVFDCAVRYRGALVGNIYSKTLRLSSASGREVGGGVASTYMSVDVERVSQGLETFHEFWAAIVSISLGVALLYSQTTWPAFFPLVITIFMIIAAGYISKGVGAAHRAWLGSTDKRVKFLASIINNALPMKLSQYEDVFARRAADLRAQEMKGARAFYYNITVTGTLASTAWAACTLSVLGPYAALVAHGHGLGALDPQRIFTVVATVNLMSPPLTILSSTMPQLRAAYASLKRIERYLLLEERQNVDVHRAENASDRNSSNSEKNDHEPSADINLERASFSWAADKPAYLGPLSVVLNPGHLHVCTGPVASGKTLFLLSILGETVRTAGTFTSSGTSIAYAAQDPLIISGTIRENILFGQEFSELWYQTVIEACALTSDINHMKSKDGTFIGEKGATLSGGQRQRISLARALYSKAPWTLLDDTFSSLDAETETHIFESLFGPNGLLRNKGVILVTHNVKHLNRADSVLILDAGAMQYQGTLDQVIAAGYQFLRHTDAENGSASKSTTHRKPEVILQTKEHVAQTERAEAPIPKSSLGYTPYLFYFRMAGWLRCFIVLALFMLTGFVRLGLQIYLQQWSESDGRHPGTWVGGYAALTVGNCLIIAVGMWAYSEVITGPIGANIHRTELQGLLQTSPSFFMTTPAGRIINRFSQDVFMTDLEFPRNLFDVVYPTVLLLGGLVFILVPTPWLTIAIPFLAAFYWLMLTFYLKTSKQFQQLSAASKSPLYTQFSTTLTGLVTIRALGVEKHFQTQINGYLDKSQIPSYLRFASIRFLRAFLALISFVLATGLSVLAVGLRHTTNPASLGLALASLTSITGQLTGLLVNLSGLENASVAISRIHQIATLPKENDPGLTGQESLPSEKTDPSDAQGAVVFQNVRLQYQADADPAVNGVSFTAAAGQKIGICGRTGSGKSSLIMALFRAVDPSLMSGQVFIDGVDTQTIPLTKLRDSMSLVAQSPFIWHAPLRHNLDPNGTSTDKDIWMALEKIGLGNAVSDLPNKLETDLDDGGSLSAGQRQLLCLARVLLRRRKIVVLDEASTSTRKLTRKSAKSFAQISVTARLLRSRTE